MRGERLGEKHVRRIYPGDVLWVRRRSEEKSIGE